MTEPSPRPEILVGIDGSEGSELALGWAYREATLRNHPVTVLLAWTADGLPRNVYRTAISADHQGLAKAASGVLDRSIARVRMPDPPVELRRTVVDSDAVGAMLERSARTAMIVVGAHGHNPLHRLMAGSVSQRILHRAHVPVVVVRGGGGSPGDARPVVVGVDGSTPSLIALRWAAEEAALRKAPLRVVHAYQLGGSPYAEVLDVVHPALRQHAEELLASAMAGGVGEAADLETTTEAVADTPARALLRESGTAQLVVVGARGYGGFRELLLGSVSHQCVMHAQCPVAVVRP
jgi:nucleotide-binding universal stress UspA family protein